MSVLSSFFKKLKEKFRDPKFLSYGILPVCRRCVYGKHYEPILIISRDRGVRIIVNLNGKTYVRKGDCLGFKECGQCFNKLKGSTEALPCEWKRI